MGGGGKGVITNLGVQKYFSFYPPCKIYPYLGGAAGTPNHLGGGIYNPKTILVCSRPIAVLAIPVLILFVLILFILFLILILTLFLL